MKQPLHQRFPSALPFFLPPPARLRAARRTPPRAADAPLPHHRLRHLAQVRRRVGVEPAPPRQRLDEAVEGHRQRPAAPSADARPSTAGSAVTPGRAGAVRKTSAPCPASRSAVATTCAQRRVVDRERRAPGNAPARSPPARAAPRPPSSSRRGCAQVSLNFSAISLAMAKPGPRPSTKAEFARTSRSDSGVQSQASAARTAPAAPPPRRAAPSSSLPLGDQRQRRQHRGHEGLGRRHALLRPGLQRQGVVAGRRHRRRGVVGDRDGQRPARAGAPHHLDDVRALPRLRDADADRAVEPQLPPVDRGDRRPDRGDRHAGDQLGGILQVGRRMVRRPARHRHDQPRVDGAHRRRRRGDLRRASRRGSAPPRPGSPRPRRSSGSGFGHAVLPASAGICSSAAKS